MRVVILYNSCWYVFLLRRNLVASLLQAGHSVTVIAPEDAYTERVRQLGASFVPIRMTRSGTSFFGEVSALAQIYVALRRVQPDVVLSFTVKCNLYAGLCKRRLSFYHVANVSGLGQLFDEHSSLYQAAHALYRLSLVRTEQVFFQNREDLTNLTQRGTVSPERTRLIPGSGVDLHRFQPQSRPAGRTRAFLMFGRLLPKKGFYHFINAAQDLKRRYGDGVAFWVLGAVDSERHESQELLKHIMDAHARGTIRYLHATDDPRPYILESDVIVLPSTYNEGVPRSLLEALACGKPIVTTDWKGCRDTIEDGRNGFLVTPDSSESLTNALHDLVTCDGTKLTEFGLRSRQIAEERFDENLVLGAYHQAIERAKSLHGEVDLDQSYADGFVGEGQLGGTRQNLAQDDELRLRLNVHG
jgi:glycosyltransferase involved in cell wall biosynthesis